MYLCTTFGKTNSTNAKKATTPPKRAISAKMSDPAIILPNVVSAGASVELMYAASLSLRMRWLSMPLLSLADSVFRYD